jgi:chromosome segregation ATPase
VAQRIEDRDCSISSDKPENQLVVAETLRSVSQSTQKAGKEDSDEKGEHISLFWRVFGGTILSISSLVVITLYQNLSSGIGDLRKDLNQERTAREGLIKKEDYNARSTAIFDRLHAVDALKADQEAMKVCLAANTAAVDGVKKDTQSVVEGLKKDVATTLDGVKKDATATTDLLKKEETQLDLIKERLTAIEAVKKDVAGLDAIKEKIATAAADLKALRDQIGKLQQEAERARSTDLERKASQELQFKQIDETLKDLQKGVQDCREKIARLEGSLPATARPTTQPNGKP